MTSAHKVMQKKVAYVLGGIALDSRLRVNEKDPSNSKTVPALSIVRGSFR